MELNGHNEVTARIVGTPFVGSTIDAEVMPFDVDSREIVKPDVTDARLAAMMAELEQARAENARLKAEREQKMTLTLKVSEKGGISVYGLGRFPVTLYAEQWEKVAKIAPQIAEFAKVNWKEINAKNTAARAAKAAKK